MIRLALFSVAPPRWCVVAVALSAANLQAAPPGLGWVMAWSDEFNGTSVDGSKWSVGTGARRDATNTTSAVSVGNGALTIKTYTEGGKHYTGWLGSNGKFENCFGYWEARIRFNSSAGMWSAFWLQPYGINNVGDPAGNGTEIDIVEHRRQDSGGGDMRNKSAMNIHWDGYGADHKSVGATVNNPGANPASLQGNWHTYGLLWESGRYRFYIDDVEVWTTTAAISQVRQWIYLTSEVQNGAWAGAIPSGGYGDRNSSTTSMEVDHVRFYQRAEQTINSHFGNRMGPWRQSGNTSWSSGGGRGGTAGARLNPSTTSGSRVEQTVAGLLPNTPYIVRGWGSVGSRSWPDIRIGARNFGGAEVFTPVWSNGFTAADCAFTTGGSNSRADVFAWVPTQWGDCYADDITVSRAGRVTNGGFESGDASHWSFSGDAFTHQWASFIRSGGGAMRLNTSTAARSAEHTVRGLKPATAYRLSAWLRGNGQPVRLGVKNHGADESFTTVTGSGGNWTRGVHAFTTGVGATAATIYAFIPSGSNIAAVDLDDFLLVEALPAGWSPAHIGSGYPGEAGASDGRLLVRGSGNNLGTTADSCHFVYQPLEGSGKIAARLNSFEAHHDRAKAGVMIRGSTAPGAPFAMVHWLPEGQVEFIWRNAPDTASSYVWAAGTTAWPPRLRLIRALNVVTAQYSTDGANWVAVGAPQALDLPGTALAGLAVTSHSTTDSAEAVFSNVSFSGDRDDDGLPDEFETNTGVYVSGTDTGTDPDNPDTDGDGFTDGFEVANGMAPLVPNLEIIWQPGAAPGGTGTWDTSSSHWTVGTAKSPWVAGKTALFGGTAGTVTVDPGVHGVAGLAFTTAGYTLAGSPLGFANEAEISLPAGTGAVTTFTMPLAGVSELRVSGGGRLDLRADNRPFAGAMVVDGNSQLRPYNTTTGAATGFETGGAETTVEIRSGSQIRWYNIAAPATYAANFHLAGEGISGGNAGALNFDTATARVITLDGAMTLDTDATIGTQNNGAFLVNGPVDGPDHVLTFLTGGSTTTLNAAARLGGLVKSGVGTLALGPAAVLTAPALTFNAGSLAIDPQASLAIGTLVCNATLALPVSQDLVLSAPLTGPGSLNKTGAGILTLAAANTFGPAGGTLTLGSGQADAGALRLAHPQAVGSHARILLNSGQAGVSRLELSGGHTFPVHVDTVGRNTAAGFTAIRNVDGTNILHGNVTITALGGAYHIEALAGSSLTITGHVTTTLNGQPPRDTRFTGDGDILLDGGLADSATATPTRLAVTKEGHGTLTLTGTSTHQLATLVKSGALRLDGAFTSSAVTVNPGATLTGQGSLPAATIGGTLLLDAARGPLAISGTLALEDAILAITGTTDAGVRILATRGTQSGAFATVTGMPVGYDLDLAYQGNAIALVRRPGAAYEIWAHGCGLDPAGDGAPGVDADGDGDVNFLEFARGGDPTLAASRTAQQPRLVAGGDGEHYLVISALVRAGADFSGDPPAAVHDGVSYVIHGGATPAAAAGGVEPTADPPGLPVPPSGYGYRSFRLSAPVSAADRGFLRIRVAQAGP